MAKAHTKKIHVPMNERPRCDTPKCNKLVQHLGTYNKDGYPNFRKYCIECHEDRMQVFRGLVENFDKRKAPKCALHTCKKHVSPFGTDKHGTLKFNVFCDDHVNLVNGYLLYRKDYCENIDGRLGKKCTTTIWWPGMLDVDHIDGNPDNNDPANLQTLCKCCHAYKTNKYGDYKTPGRKAIKEAKKNGVFTRLVG